ncbi:MAG: sigma-70 family RNA polymerase sigma factor [Verrucomicrobia bacterium]|nr:sigma-70 family RNA polymerase sigma factor [Verrucomicrobiota bacterium]
MEANDAHSENDWEIARRAANGDEDAYACLIARYQAPIHSFVYRSVGNEETSLDITQEVFVKAWFALGRVREKARFSTWLFQIAVNLCRDHVKSKANRQSRVTYSFARDERDEKPGEREFAHPDPAPDRQAELSENASVLDAEIRNLPGDLRPAFLLGAVEGVSHKEAAEILGISAKAVEVRIYRARRILVERLSAQGIIPS